MRDLSRRSVTALCGGLGLSLLLPRLAKAQASLLRRPIPHGNGETIPVVGVGTVEVYAYGSSSQDLAGPTGVVRALVSGGGSVIDTAPSYSDAEEVIGDVLAETGLRSKVFLATKLERYEPGREAEEARGSLQRMKTAKLDLLQLHNVTDPGQPMDGLNALKAQGLCRYTGITSTYRDSYDALEAITKRSKPDFLEVDYAINNRDAEQRILPAARDAGTAVLVALPFGRGRLFRKALGQKLPDWAKEFDCTSWAQFFLKFILANPAITAVIPGTNKAEHMIDNLGAGRGRLPDAKERARMIAYVDSLG